MGDPLDPGVLEGFVRGDEGAFELVYRRFQGDVFRWVVRIVRDGTGAEDVVVEAFWRAYRGRARLDPTRSFGAWMRRVATNAALDHLRSVRREAKTRDLPSPVSGSDDDGALADALAVAFRRLSPRLQVVATLALVEGLAHAEIADALGVPLGTVKSRVFRATRALINERQRLGVRP